MPNGIDPFNVAEMEDSELREFVWRHLGNYIALDAERIYVQVEDGAVRLIGRVGEEQESVIAEQVLTDILGLDNVDNQLIVDPVVRMDVDRPGDLELDVDDDDDDGNDWPGLLNSDGLDSSETRETETWDEQTNGREDDEDQEIDLPEEPRGL